jgi:hypothetical protein
MKRAYRARQDIGNGFTDADLHATVIHHRNSVQSCAGSSRERERERERERQKREALRDCILNWHQRPKLCFRLMLLLRHAARCRRKSSSSSPPPHPHPHPKYRSRPDYSMPMRFINRRSMFLGWASDPVLV